MMRMCEHFRLHIVAHLRAMSVQSPASRLEADLPHSFDRSCLRQSIGIPTSTCGGTAEKHRLHAARLGCFGVVRWPCGDNVSMLLSQSDVVKRTKGYSIQCVS